MGGVQTEPVVEQVPTSEWTPENPLTEAHRDELNKFIKCTEELVEDLKEVVSYQNFRDAYFKAEKAMEQIPGTLPEMAGSIIPTSEKPKPETPNSGAEGEE